MQVNIKKLTDNAQCYATVRQLRWPEGTQCPFCNSKRVIKRASTIKNLPDSVMSAKIVENASMI